MLVYSTDINNIPKIRSIFYGYIFRKTENGVGYVKCSLKEKEILESHGIKLIPKY